MTRGSAEPLGDVVADPDRVRHHRERRVDRADAREDARVGEIQVVQLVRLAGDVGNGRLRIVAETDRPGLMCDAGDWYPHVHVEVLGQDMMRGQPGLVQYDLQLAVQ